MDMEIFFTKVLLGRSDRQLILHLLRCNKYCCVAQKFDDRVTNDALAAPRAAAVRCNWSVIRDRGLKSAHIDLRLHVRTAAARCVASRASQIRLHHMRQNNTTGKSAKPVQCSREKYFAFAVEAEQVVDRLSTR